MANVNTVHEIIITLNSFSVGKLRFTGSLDEENMVFRLIINFSNHYKNEFFIFVKDRDELGNMCYKLLIRFCNRHKLIVMIKSIKNIILSNLEDFININNVGNNSENDCYIEYITSSYDFRIGEFYKNIFINKPKQKGITDEKIKKCKNVYYSTLAKKLTVEIYELRLKELNEYMVCINFRLCDSLLNDIKYQEEIEINENVVYRYNSSLYEIYRNEILKNTPRLPKYKINFLYTEYKNVFIENNTRIIYPKGNNFYKDKCPEVEITVTGEIFEFNYEANIKRESIQSYYDMDEYNKIDSDEIFRIIAMAYDSSIENISITIQGPPNNGKSYILSPISLFAKNNITCDGDIDDDYIKNKNITITTPNGKTINIQIISDNMSENLTNIDKINNSINYISNASLNLPQNRKIARIESCITIDYLKNVIQSKDEIIAALKERIEDHKNIFRYIQENLKNPTINNNNNKIFHAKGQTLDQQTYESYSKILNAPEYKQMVLQYKMQQIYPHYRDATELEIENVNKH